MMKKTLCLLFVLAFIAQICAIPADHGIAEKDFKGAADHAAAVKDGATKDATDTANNAMKHATDAAKKATKDATDMAHKATRYATDAADKATGAAANFMNKGEHGASKHGGKDCHKPGTHQGPISSVVKGTEEVGKKIADASVKAATDFMKIFGL